MKVFPQQLKNRPDIDLKLGIKSSLGNLESLFALVYVLYETNPTESFLDYSVKSGKEIVINPLLLKKIFTYFKFSNIYNSKQATIENAINQNPLLKSQIEPLQVGLELFWRISKIRFVDNFASSKERTGGERFTKRLFFTSNLDIIKIALDNLDEDLKKTYLIGRILEINPNFNTTAKSDYDKDPKQIVNSLLTLFSEETIFKIRTDTSNEVQFRQENIYSELLSGNSVDNSDYKEDVGPFRILKSFVSSNIHSLLKSSSLMGFELKDTQTLDSLKVYTEKVSNFLDITTRKNIVYETLVLEEEKTLVSPLKKAYNRIYFGCPGTGKSTTVEGEIKDNYQETITFHPEFDYASFIGCYKPFTEVKGEEKIISYQFVAQAFIKLYVEAWKNLDKAYYFVIEEINRGNCAAIFGDIFQLLDRDLQGYSRYFISIDSDLANYLENELKDESGYTSVINSLYLQKRKTACKNPCQVMLLPNNLSILATMNTSDQSLFPMDSAFKRRWEWKYIAIDYGEAKKIQLKIADNSYNWGEFLLSINKQIFEITESEDKQMGTFFVVPDGTVISQDVFLNKVLFYLWYDVLKNEGKETIAKVFQNIGNEGFHYAAFFTLSEEEKQSWLKAFFTLHNIPAISKLAETDETAE